MYIFTRSSVAAFTLRAGYFAAAGRGFFGGAEKAESTREVYRQLVSELFGTLSEEDQGEPLRLMGLLRRELRRHEG